MPTTTSQRVRVVLVNFRSEADVQARLGSAALKDADVIVVDNASDPARVQRLCEEYGATAVLLPANGGFARGVNAGWDVARTREPLPLLLLNPDAELSLEALDTLLEALGSLDGVGPLLLEGPDQPQVGTAGGPLTLRSVVAYFFLLSHVLPRLRGLFFTRAQAKRGGSVAWLCMASLLLSPTALDRFGRVPEEEIVYGEDIAWGTAATAAGARFVLVPEAVVPHAHGSSGGSAGSTGAVERLLLRRLGRLRGSAAIAVVRAGLLGRSWARRVG